MNDVDRANDLAAAEVEAGIAGRVVYSGESADNCVVCGKQIPSGRQLAVPGVDTCIGCAVL